MTCLACDAPAEPVTLKKHDAVKYRTFLCAGHLNDATVNLGYEVNRG